VHNKRHRESEHATAQDHQDPRPLPQRRGRHQAAVAGATQRAGKVRESGIRLESGDEPVCYSVWRALHARTWLEIFNPPRTQKCGQVPITEQPPHQPPHPSPRPQLHPESPA
ncbi:hypothetical protein PQQ68_35650, partial [Paraburkholderia dilworthii]